MQRLPAALLAALILIPGSAAAAEPLPDEPGTILLERTALTAVVADVDADGIRDLVRIIPSTANPANVAVDVVRFPPDGAPAELTSQDLYRVADVDEQLGGGPPAADGLLRVRTDDAARLVVWHQHGVERVLVLAIGRLQGRPNCCLTAWLVRAGAAGTELRRMPGTYGTARFVRVADLDADGTDELVATSQPDTARPDRLPVVVYRWSGGGFVPDGATLEPAEVDAPLVLLGDSDGRPGVEVGVRAELGGSSLSGAAVLHRISLDEHGDVRVERSGLPFAGEIVPVDGPDGPRIALARQGLGTAILRWPAGASSAQVVATSARQGTPVAVLGRGTDARLLLQRVEDTIDVVGPDLAPAQGVLGLPAAAAFRGTDLVPYVGQLPGGTADGRAAFIFRGRMVSELDPADPRGVDLLQEMQVAAFADSVPVGLVGWQLGLMVVAPRGSFDAARDGGQLTDAVGPPAGVRLAVASAAAVLIPEPAGGALDPEMRGAVDTGRQPARPILASRGSFEMGVSGPLGTRVILELDGIPARSSEIDETGQATVDVALPPDEASGTRHVLRLLAITPTGHGYGGLWELNVLTRQPELAVTATTESLRFAARLSGRTLPGATLTVDGETVPTSADGTFLVEVDAGILPRLVSVVASDALGNRTDTAVSVVGLVDYRSWPWIAIVVLLTLAAGMLLYLRVPKPSPLPPARPEDGVLEELD